MKINSKIFNIKRDEIDHNLTMKPAIYLPPECESPGSNNIIYQRNLGDNNKSTFSASCFILFFGLFMLFVILLVYIAFDRIEHKHVFDRMRGK